MPVIRREPVIVISGLISAVLVALVALGLDVPEGTEAALQAGVAAVAGVFAAWKVRTPDKPTAVVGGLVAAAFVALAALGLEAGEETVTTIQSFAVLVVSWLVRERVTPEETA